MKSIKPNFICPGVQKAATTTLYHILRQHPEIYFPVLKEPSFFCCDEKYNKGVNDYYNTHYNIPNKNYKIIGDMSTSYMNASKKSSERILKHLGKDIKIIIILRNPIYRAISHYTMTKRLGWEKKAFHEVIRKEKERVESMDFSKILQNPWDYTYVENGRYLNKILDFTRVFPKENIKFVLFEEFISDKEGIVKDIFSFLGVRDDVDIDYNIKTNQSGDPVFKHFTQFVFGNNPIKKFLKRIIPFKIRKKVTWAVLTKTKKEKNKEEIRIQDIKYLYSIYEKEYVEIEKITELDLSKWRNVNIEISNKGI